MSVTIFIKFTLIEEFVNFNLSFMESKDDAGFIWTKIRITCTSFRAAEITQSM
jgi:hypothetical protein